MCHLLVGAKKKNFPRVKNSTIISQFKILTLTIVSKVFVKTHVKRNKNLSKKTGRFTGKVLSLRGFRRNQFLHVRNFFFNELARAFFLSVVEVLNLSSKQRFKQKFPCWTLSNASLPVPVLPYRTKVFLCFTV